MRVLQTATFIEANSKNFNQAPRPTANIKFIVIHYTSNVNDTARNNALYFHDVVTQSSAHYFVSGTSIYQSVPDNHAAYAVGLGSMKEPYFHWPSMWKKITNSNSISIELCGSKNSSEASAETKDTAAKLAADLLEKYGLTPDALYRHYDVTGKCCPAWAVNDLDKWYNFKLAVRNYFTVKEGEDDMRDTEENYKQFVAWMNRYIGEQGAFPSTWEEEEMQFCDQENIITGGRPKSWITRGEVAAVVQRICAKFGIY